MSTGGRRTELADGDLTADRVDPVVAGTKASSAHPPIGDAAVATGHPRDGIVVATCLATVGGLALLSTVLPTTWANGWLDAGAVAAASVGVGAACLAGRPRLPLARAWIVVAIVFVAAVPFAHVSLVHLLVPPAGDASAVRGLLWWLAIGMTLVAGYHAGAAEEPPRWADIPALAAGPVLLLGLVRGLAELPRMDPLRSGWQAIGDAAPFGPRAGAAPLGQALPDLALGAGLVALLVVGAFMVEVARRLLAISGDRVARLGMVGLLLWLLTGLVAEGSLATDLLLFAVPGMAFGRRAAERRTRRRLTGGRRSSPPLNTVDRRALAVVSVLAGCTLALLVVAEASARAG